jgi:hypothetical protein
MADPAELLPDILCAVAAAAVADGMNPDLTSVTFTFDPKTGGVKIEAKPADGGTPYTNDMGADELAAALEMDVTEDAAETDAAAPTTNAPDEGEKVTK